MALLRSIARALHDEHDATLALLDRLDAFAAARAAPAAGDAAARRLLREVALALDGEVGAHFAFEEERLFPLLEARGEGDIGGLLADEHRTIAPVAADLVASARAAGDTGFDAASWARFKRLAAELAERLTAHVQKEEMALLPLLDDLLDEAADAELAAAYALQR